MRVSRLFAAIGGAALVQPPVAVEAHILSVPSCGGPAHLMMVPGNPVDPDRRRDCAKACHAVTDRRGKSGGVKKGCC